MENEISFAPKNVRSHEIKTQNTRLEATKKMNIENIVKAALRNLGAMKVSVGNFGSKDDMITVVASYIFKDELRKTTFNMKADKLGNIKIHEFETAFNAYEKVVRPSKERTMIMPENKLIIDLSVIRAIQRGAEYSVEHPVIGKIGTLVKDEITEDNIKKIFAMFADDTGADIQYINAFKVNFKDEDFTYDKPSYEEGISTDKNIQAKNEIFAHSKAKVENLNASLRETFNHVINAKASNLVKQLAYTYKTGPIKIINSQSFVELAEGKYLGNVVVNAKVGNQEKTFALPVERGIIILKGDINNYIIDEKEFHDLVKASIDSHLKLQLKKDLDNISVQEAHDIATISGEKIEAIRTQDVIKKFPVLRMNLEEVEIGDVINLSGIKYKVEAGDNDSYFNLILQEG